VLSDATMTQYQLRENDVTYSYDDNVNPTIANVFSTAAFRFGHSQIKQTVRVSDVIVKVTSLDDETRHVI
jgi:hypothetical protein